MQNETGRCGECDNCKHVANSAQYYSKSPTDRRQFKELGEMFPCEKPVAK